MWILFGFASILFDTLRTWNAKSQPSQLYLFQCIPRIAGLYAVKYQVLCCHWWVLNTAIFSPEMVRW